jgi:hypothetical protein
MTCREFVLLGLFFVNAVIGGQSAMAAQGELTPVANLPQVVSSALDEAVPDMKWIIAFKFPADSSGKAWYRVAGRADKGLVKVMVYADGAVIDVREVINAGEVPVVVSNALQSARPRFEAKQIEAVGRQINKVVYYRFEGKSDDGTDKVVLVSANGRKVIDE